MGQQYFTTTVRRRLCLRRGSLIFFHLKESHKKNVTFFFFQPYNKDKNISNPLFGVGCAYFGSIHKIPFCVHNCTKQKRYVNWLPNRQPKWIVFPNPPSDRLGGRIQQASVPRYCIIKSGILCKTQRLGALVLRSDEQPCAFDCKCPTRQPFWYYTRHEAVYGYFHLKGDDGKQKRITPRLDVEALWIRRQKASTQ